MAKISAYTEDTAPNQAAEVIIAYAGNNFRTKLSNLPAKAWTAFTPVWTQLTVGSGTVTAKYVQLGKTVHFYITISFSSTSIAGAVSFTLPVTAIAGAVNTVPGNVRMIDANGSQYPGIITINAVTTATLRALTASGTYLVEAALSATVPFTWADGDVITIAGTYEAA